MYSSIFCLRISSVPSHSSPSTDVRGRSMAASISSTSTPPSSISSSSLFFFFFFFFFLDVSPASAGMMSAMSISSSHVGFSSSPSPSPSAAPYSSAIFRSCASASQSPSRSSVWSAAYHLRQRVRTPGEPGAQRTFALLETLPALVPDALELRAELLELERLEPLDLLALAEELFFLACLALLARLLPARVLAAHERGQVARVPHDLCRTPVFMRMC